MKLWNMCSSWIVNEEDETLKMINMSEWREEHEGKEDSTLRNSEALWIMKYIYVYPTACRKFSMTYIANINIILVRGWKIYFGYKHLLKITDKIIHCLVEPNTQLYIFLDHVNAAHLITISILFIGPHTIFMEYEYWLVLSEEKVQNCPIIRWFKTVCAQKKSQSDFYLRYSIRRWERQRIGYRENGTQNVIISVTQMEYIFYDL